MEGIRCQGLWPAALTLHHFITHLLLYPTLCLQRGNITPTHPASPQAACTRLWLPLHSLQWPPRASYLQRRHKNQARNAPLLSGQGTWQKLPLAYGGESSKEGPEGRGRCPEALWGHCRAGSPGKDGVRGGKMLGFEGLALETTKVKSL